jgi:ribosomal protein S18 acetylase RimI-like enzyme
MTGKPALRFRCFSSGHARAERDTVELIYRDSYTAEQQADPFNSPETWMSRFDSYAAGAGFDLVIAYDGETPAGQAWGWPLRAGSSWWTGLIVEPEPGFTAETGRRTFALSEIMVRQGWGGRGIAHALHDKLLAGRNEERATLLVEPENTTAYRAYTSWGWQHVAQLRPAWPDAPLFDVLILPLPVR